MNKKIIAILITAITVSGLSAKFCRDENGNRVSCTGKVAAGTGGFLANAVTLGGYSRQQRRDAEKNAAMQDEQDEDENEDEDYNNQDME